MNDMTIAEFNELYRGKFRLQELRKVTKHSRYALQEWCPNLNDWKFHLNCNIFVLRTMENPIPDDQRRVPPYIFDAMNSQFVILDHDEYGVQVYAARNTEEATLSALDILQNDNYSTRLQCLECDPPTEEPKRKPEDFQDDPSLREVIEKQWHSYNRQRADYEEYIHLKKEYDTAVETENGLLAMQVLASLAGDDDRVEIKELTVVQVEQENETHPISEH